MVLLATSFVCATYLFCSGEASRVADMVATSQIRRCLHPCLHQRWQRIRPPPRRWWRIQLPPRRRRWIRPSPLQWPRIHPLLSGGSRSSPLLGGGGRSSPLLGGGGGSGLLFGGGDGSGSLLSDGGGSGPLFGGSDPFLLLGGGFDPLLFPDGAPLRARRRRIQDGGNETGLDVGPIWAGVGLNFLLLFYFDLWRRAKAITLGWRRFPCPPPLI
jgi:hypothetical protein